MRFLKYVGVQLVAYGFDVGSFVLLGIFFGIPPLYSNLIGKIIAGAFAYSAHSLFTFDVSLKERSCARAVKYALLLAINAPLSTAVLALVLLGGRDLVGSKFVADAACVVLTYWLSKRFVFLSDPSPSVNSSFEEKKE